MYSRVENRAAQRYLHSQAQSFGAFFERTAHGDIIYIFNLAVVYSLEPAYAPPTAYAIPESPCPKPMPAEMAWTHAQQQASVSLPTVRGRAMDTSENVKTIDIKAVNE